MRTALRRAAAALLAAWLLPGAQAQQPAPRPDCPPPASEPAAEQAPRDRGLLWRVSRDGRSSYLYGTLHVGRRSWGEPGPGVGAALQASEVVALEIDLLDPAIQRRLAAAMAAGPSDSLPGPLAARIAAQLELACLAGPAISALAPEIQLAALTALAARGDGLDPAHAIDAALARQARERGKPVLSLESPEDQVALLRGEGESSREMLEAALGRIERGQARPLLLRIARVWEDGRLDELARYAEWCDCAGTEAERATLRRLLDDRNPPLAERIAALHAQGRRVFAAVGALHMVGPAGLPVLLAERGFAVERIAWSR